MKLMTHEWRESTEMSDDWCLKCQKVRNYVIMPTIVLIRGSFLKFRGKGQIPWLGSKFYVPTNNPPFWGNFGHPYIVCRKSEAVYRKTATSTQTFNSTMPLCSWIYKITRNIQYFSMASTSWLHTVIRLLLVLSLGIQQMLTDTAYKQN